MWIGKHYFGIVRHLLEHWLHRAQWPVVLAKKHMRAYHFVANQFRLAILFHELIECTLFSCSGAQLCVAKLPFVWVDAIFWQTQRRTRKRTVFFFFLMDTKFLKRRKWTILCLAYGWHWGNWIHVAKINWIGRPFLRITRRAQYLIANWINWFQVTFLRHIRCACHWGCVAFKFWYQISIVRFVSFLGEEGGATRVERWFVSVCVQVHAYLPSSTAVRITFVFKVGNILHHPLVNLT